MNNTTLQIKFKQRLNKLASNDYDNIECWQIVEAFNKAQVEWCRRQLHGNNMYKEGDEASKRRVDDLQPLLESTILTGEVFDDYFEGTNFPDDYMEFKRVSVNATSDCCDEARAMTVYLAEEANVDLIMRDPLKRPDFEWSETFCTMAANTVKVYRKDFTVVEPTLTYYRQPVRMEIARCLDPYTTAGSPFDVECEFKDDVVELIIDEAVAIIAGDIDSVNQYARGSQSAEKNN
mgnify:FL=1|jgi:hypothetical protein|tara:strand:- start:176 stop:877 length:702 start_codon:yes stop_codon:yes gene_type:complete